MVLYYILLPLAWIVFHVGFRVRAEGRDNLKKIRTRGYILAPNHISAIDPVFVIITRFWGRRMIVFAQGLPLWERFPPVGGKWQSQKGEQLARQRLRGRVRQRKKKNTAIHGL